MQPFTPSRSRAKTVIFSCSCPDGSTGGEIGGATEPYMAMGSIMTGNCILTCEEERPWEVKVNINFKPVLLFLCYSSDLEVEIKKLLASILTPEIDPWRSNGELCGGNAPRRCNSSVLNRS
jgi:hypothetical protein